MVFKYNMRLKISVLNRCHLEVVFKALKPETRTLAIRSRTTLGKEGRFLVLNIKAKDTVALRAASNAYLRWINSLISVLDALDTQQTG